MVRNLFVTCRKAVENEKCEGLFCKQNGNLVLKSKNLKLFCPHSQYFFLFGIKRSTDSTLAVPNWLHLSFYTSNKLPPPSPPWCSHQQHPPISYVLFGIIGGNILLLVSFIRMRRIIKWNNVLEVGTGDISIPGFCLKDAEKSEEEVRANSRCSHPISPHGAFLFFSHLLGSCSFFGNVSVLV